MLPCNGKCLTVTVRHISFNILAPLGENAMNVGASPFNSSSVVVSWSPPQTPQGVITSYIVYKYQPPPSPTAVRAAEVNGSQRQEVVAELTPYTEYKFTVKACNSFACSGHSPEALAQTLAAGMLYKITDLLLFWLKRSLHVKRQ